MAVVQALRPAGTETRADVDRVNVVRLVEYLGPISPELALVDPELAERARALLPEAPGVRTLRRNGVQPLESSFPSSPKQSRPRRLLGVCVVSGVAAVLAVGAWAVSGLWNDEPTSSIRSSPRVAAPPLGAVPVEPTQGSASKPPGAASPRFVWAAESGAGAYRVAIFRAGRQIFEVDVKVTSVEFSQSWTYGGRFYTLSRGTYRWVVWPLFGNGSTMRLGPAIVSARYTV